MWAPSSLSAFRLGNLGKYCCWAIAAAEALTIARAVGQAALAADAEAVLAGAQPAPADVGPRLDVTPFLDGAAPVDDPEVLARRAELALTTASDVFAVPQTT